jgi:AP2-associated kinase
MYASSLKSTQHTSSNEQQIYAQRTQSEAARNQKLPDTTSSIASPPPAGISRASPTKQKQVIPDIAPMRRGRPTTSSQPPVAAAKTLSSTQGDPFAALDSTSNTIRSRAVDELSAKYPSLDEFSITHELAGFSFSSSKPKQNDPVTSALADEVFARPAASRDTASQNQKPISAQTAGQSTKPQESSARTGAPPKPQTLLHQPAPQKPNYSSAGTMISRSSTTPSSQPVMPKLPDVTKRPIWRVPEPSRPSSQPRASPVSQTAAERLQPSAPPAQRPALVDAHRSKSQTATVTLAKQTTSSRPSLEGHRPSFNYEDNISRARSVNSRPRPISAAYVDSNLDYLREQEAERKRPSLEVRRSSRSIKSVEIGFDDANIERDADYLRNLEGNDSLSRKGSGKEASHKKRSSMSSFSLGGTKNMLSSRFGDAFKKSESTGGEAKTEKGRGAESGFRTPSPNPPVQAEAKLLSLTPGSDTAASPPRRTEAINADLSDLLETEDLPPEMRREMERLQLVQEEKRVAAAAAEYRSRGSGRPVPSKANMIQQRVQSLLVDGQKPPVYKRQAEGYGRFTEKAEVEEGEQKTTRTARQASIKKQPPPVARKPATSVPSNAPGDVDMNLRYHKVRQSQSFPTPAGTYPLEHTVSAPQPRTEAAAPRPNTPAKPATLRTSGSAMSQNRPGSSGLSSPVYSQAPAASSVRGGSSLAALIARDNEGVAGVGAGTGVEQSIKQESEFANQADYDDWQADFSKRYPSLSGIEMVERDIAARSGGGSKEAGGRRGMSVRDV